MLVLVGGNSEAAHGGGIWKLYRGRDEAAQAPLLRSIRDSTGLKQPEIATYYFSWTGDDEDDRANLLPGHWNWIFGGADRIADSLRKALDSGPAQTRLAIVGWSNGAATAYELACTLAPTHPASLLVTLDPVAWTTRPCSYYSRSALQTPAHWVDVYTESGWRSRFNAGNIIAMLGRAWDGDKLPSQPAELHRLHPANHGDTGEMWQQKVVPGDAYQKWARAFKQ